MRIKGKKAAFAWEALKEPPLWYMRQVEDTALHIWGGAHQTSNHLLKPNL